MAKAKTTKEKVVSLEDVLWECRVALRGVGSLDKNRNAVISLVFLKFAGDKFDKRRAEILAEHGNIPAFLEKKSFYNAKNVFYLKETSRWSYIKDNASKDNITYFATIQFYFFFTNWYATIMRIANGIVNTQVLIYSVIGIIGCMIGDIIGKIIFNKLNAEKLKYVIYVGMIISGIIMLF